MSEFSHLKHKLLAEQVEDQIYHYILDTPRIPATGCPTSLSWESGSAWGAVPSGRRQSITGGSPL